MQSLSQIITPTNQHPTFLYTGRPSCHPTNSTKGKVSHSSVDVGGLAQWIELWFQPANFPYPAPDCYLDG